LDTVTVHPPSPETKMETVVCSVCNRKRNIASDSLPDDISTFVCLSCQSAAA
jgi:formylmethanofuran dehydrogenase subunit E